MRYIRTFDSFFNWLVTNYDVYDSFTLDFDDEPLAKADKPNLSDCVIDLRKLILDQNISELDFMLLDKEKRLALKNNYAQKHKLSEDAINKLDSHIRRLESFLSDVMDSSINFDAEDQVKTEKYLKKFQSYKLKVNLDAIAKHNKRFKDYSENPSLRLGIELIPTSSWWQNARMEEIMKDSEWNRIRYVTYGLDNFRCQVCNGIGTKHHIECHENWEYDYKNKIQRLIKFQSLCPLCHHVKHLGHAGVLNFRDRAVDRFIAFNNLTQNKADKLIDKAFDTFEKRSKVKWKLDVSVLTMYNIDVPKKHLAKK